MNARSLIEGDAERAEADDELLGPQPGDMEVHRVTVAVRGENAEKFPEFMRKVSGLCNAGASRRLVIEDPSSEDEKQIHWSFDGDGSTKMKVEEPAAVDESMMLEVAAEPIAQESDQLVVKMVTAFRSGMRYLTITDSGLRFYASREQATKENLHVPSVTFKLADMVGATYQ